MKTKACLEILKFDIFFLWHLLMKHVSHTRQPIIILRKPDTLWLIVRHFAHTAESDTFNRRMLSHFTPYSLLTLPQKKTLLKLYFYHELNVHLLSSLMM